MDPSFRWDDDRTFLGLAGAILLSIEVPCAQPLTTFIAALLSSRNTVTRRMRIVERDQTMPICRGTLSPGNGKRTSFSPSGHGLAQSGTSETPSPRSTITAL